MGVFDDQMNKTNASEGMGHCPRVCLVEPHQRGVDDKLPFHAEIEGQLHCLDCVLSTIRIPRKICLAHSGDEMTNTAPVGNRSCHRQEQKVPARYESVRQSSVVDLYLNIAGEGCFANGVKCAKVDYMVISEATPPLRVTGTQLLKHDTPALQLDGVPLTVVEANRLNVRKSVECPC